MPKRTAEIAFPKDETENKKRKATFDFFGEQRDITKNILSFLDSRDSCHFTMTCKDGKEFGPKHYQITESEGKEANAHDLVEIRTDIYDSKKARIRFSKVTTVRITGNTIYSILLMKSLSYLPEIFPNIQTLQIFSSSYMNLNIIPKQIINLRIYSTYKQKERGPDAVSLLQNHDFNELAFYGHKDARISIGEECEVSGGLTIGRLHGIGITKKLNAMDGPYFGVIRSQFRLVDEKIKNF